MIIQFLDKEVSYDTFVNDVSRRIAEILKNDEEKMLSQAKAFKRFGRGNVERWRQQGKIQPCKRPGKLEYNLEELIALQKTQQDYF